MWTSTARDDYVSVGIQSHLPDRDPLYLKDSDVDFRISINAPGFDNRMNPYGEIKVHLYTTMNGMLEDIIIPLTTDCDISTEDSDHANVWNQDTSNIYCPQFSREHYLKNSIE